MIFMIFKSEGVSEATLGLSLIYKVNSGEGF